MVILIFSIKNELILVVPCVGALEVEKAVIQL